MTRLETYDDPADFLAEAGAFVAADPVLATVVASVTARAARDDADGRARPDHPRWWALARSASGEVVGVAMRTAPFAPYPAYLLAMPDDAVAALDDLLAARGESVGGTSGALPAARLLAEAAALRQGGRVVVQEHLRLFELPGPAALVTPRPVAGALRAATAEDLPLAVAWFRAFHADAAAQAGHEPLAGAGEHFDDDAVLARIEDGVVWLWEDAGAVVHLTGANLPAHGVVRIGPVYTPPSQRGRGYASNAVAEVSRAMLAAGHRVCLFTDQGNPVANRVYEALGYRPVVDMAMHLVV